MNIQDLKPNVVVRNIKYGNLETILHLGKMKLESGQWTDAVIYEGEDRFTGETTIFCKKTDDFIQDFDVVSEEDDEDFKRYMNDVYSQLECNVTDDYKEKYPYNVFGYTKQEIDDNKIHFLTCYRTQMSAYKALTFLNIR